MKPAIALTCLFFAAVLYAQDTSLHDILIDGEDWKPAATGYTFCDGLAADAEGNLLFSDVKSGRGVYKLWLDGKVTLVIDHQPGISGLRVGADGRLYACQNKSGRVVVFEKDGAVKELATNVKCNDLTSTMDGFVYFTETPTKRVHGITPGGKSFVADEGHVNRPNGITLSADGATLAVSDHGGMNVWAWQIQPDGKLAGAAPYMTMLLAPLKEKRETLGDGSTTDIKGRYYVTTEIGIQVFDATGRLAGVIAKPARDSKIVSVQFAGAGHSTLFVSAGDTIWQRRTQTSAAWRAGAKR
jgi:enterochelin esterase family protein